MTPGRVLTASGGVNAVDQRAKPYLVLISLDGFKAEYLDRFDLPNLRRLAARGARAKAMVPVFPSLTFPNHYSLVTGLDPQRHGIVNNRFYDPARKDTYVYTEQRTVTDGSWYGGEPIWVTAESQGMVSACYFWPGSEAAIKGVRPTTFNSYTSGVTNEARVKTVLSWLDEPVERRPHMITLYFSELDEVSHTNPLEAPEVVKAAQSLDAAIGQLMDGIDRLAGARPGVSPDHVRPRHGQHLDRADRAPRLDPGRHGNRQRRGRLQRTGGKSAHLGWHRPRPADSRSHQRAGRARDSVPAAGSAGTIQLHQQPSHR